MKKDVKKTATKYLETQFNLYVYTSIVLSLIMIVIGLILYNVPDIAVKVVSWIIGIYFIVQGAVSIYAYIKKKNLSMLSLNLIYGILGIVLGLNRVSSDFEFLK